MDAVTVTVLVGGWWLPGRSLVAGETLTLDAATAEALARRGIVRIDPPRVASNVDTPATTAKTRKPRKETAR